MSDKNISFKEAGRKVFRTAFGDRLVDIFLPVRSHAIRGILSGRMAVPNLRIFTSRISACLGISADVIFLTGLFILIAFVQDNSLPKDDHTQWEGKNG